jgi:hypothetical protein
VVGTVPDIEKERKKPVWGSTTLTFVSDKKYLCMVFIHRSEKMSAKKSASKKSAAKKSVAKKVSTKATKKPNLLHEKLVKLFCRPNGATLTDTKEAGFEYPAMAAL